MVYNFLRRGSLIHLINFQCYARVKRLKNVGLDG